MYQDYKNLIIWQKAMDLVQEVYRLVKLLPKEETYALSDQMRRAAISIPSNIAEGNGRGSDKEKRQFLCIAQGSKYELETQLLICVRLRYMTEEQISTAFRLCDEIEKILTAFTSEL